jgi:hypothetical protein
MVPRNCSALSGISILLNDIFCQLYYCCKSIKRRCFPDYGT